ncbi:RNA polymerase sigma-70 factor [Gracilimonas tropica]|uniref:RNA polymerase sigma-70 factor n=1 Tax=Gracilimonas tropica TaxID=454600 RepID=UPI0003718161|nr:RNA polymerase sigma-70 factor [Gracilimonas tropica]
MFLSSIFFSDKKEPCWDDSEWVAMIKKGDDKAFEQLFFRYHKELSHFANSITRSREFARDAVQDVFLKIWRNRENWEIQVSIKAYLYQSVRNQSLNLLEKQYTRLRIIDEYQSEQQGQKIYSVTRELIPDDISDEEQVLIRKIWKIVDRMPDRRRMVFELNRKHGLSYKEVAKVLDISRKTVENHVANALQDIRDELQAKGFTKIFKKV